jgi:hypothetical protein
MKAVQEALELSDKQFDFILRKWPEYFSARIRRQIPPPDELVEQLSAVYQEFEHCVDIKGKRLLAPKKLK